MNVTIIGTGYVGLVTGACLADMGNHVFCLDVDEAKVRRLNDGEIPIFEPGLEAVVRRNEAAGRLVFSTDVAASVRHGALQCIAVGTPPDENGSADLQHVLAAAAEVGRHMDDYRVIVNKSTVPVGTADRVREAVAESWRSGEKARARWNSAWSRTPSSSRRATPVEDFMRPDRIIVGSDDERATRMLRELYAPFQRNHERLMLMSVRSAELTKYAANAMLATRISFMNELANLAERLGADIEEVRRGIGSDPRIGYHFLYAGAGFGGSCFPKDVRALQSSAQEVGRPLGVLAAVERANEVQKRVLADKIRARFGASLAGRRIALWGPCVQAEHRRHARSAEPRADRRPARLRALGARVRPGGAGRSAQDFQRRAASRDRRLGDRLRLGLRRACDRHRVAGIQEPGFRGAGAPLEDAAHLRRPQPL
jgi:UDPglucose 6-dehydrogenase